MQRAIDLEPLEPINHALASQVAFQAGEHARAVEYAQQSLGVEPQFWIGYMQLGQAYERQQKIDLALKALMDAERCPGGGNSKALSLKGYCLAKAGRPDEARAVLRALETPSNNQYIPPYAVAQVYAGFDDREAVFKWLDRAIDAGDAHLIFLPVDGKWDPYRTDPRFQALLERCGFTQPRKQRR
jgi:tetratricopeptide (TPR) repeat protein